MRTSHPGGQRGACRATSATAAPPPRRRSHARAELRELLERRWIAALYAALDPTPRFSEVMTDLDEWRTTPDVAADTLLEDAKRAVTHDPGAL
jgi:hypothetical protein